MSVLESFSKFCDTKKSSYLKYYNKQYYIILKRYSSYVLKNNIGDKVLAKKILDFINKRNETWTFTFSESVENHAGMQQIGKIAKHGFTKKDLLEIYNKFDGFDKELIDLDKETKIGNEAYILVIRDGLNKFMNNEDIFNFIKETKESNVDKKVFMRGQVKNKLARWNLCYSDKSQEPDYINKKGTIIDFKSVPYLNKLREGLSTLNNKSNNLNAELMIRAKRAL